MKKTWILATTLIALPVFADTIPNGSFRGVGHWNMPQGEKGDYTLTVKVDNGTIENHYEMKDGSKKEWTFQMAPTSQNFFEVKTNGVVLGDGYCLERTPLCHYEFTAGRMKVEETITLQNGHLYRFGSKDDGKKHVKWQEGLTQE